jgi:hypothetical protein
MNKNCGKKTTAHSQHILHEDDLYNIKRKKYKTVYAELTFAKVTFDTCQLHESLIKLYFKQFSIFQLF